MEYPQGTKHFDKDSLGREMLQVGKNNFVVDEKENFFIWIEKRYGSTSEFMKLKSKDKEKIFLRWKHGFTNDTTNRTVELTEQSILSQTRDMEFKDSGWKFHIECKRKFNEQCNKIKERIGLIRESVNPEMEKIMATFGGSEIE